MKAASLSILLSLALACSGCGVFRSTSAMVQAEQRLQSARLAGAEAKAPYEFTLGVEYLRKAKEEDGYSDYQVAEQLARQAQALLADAEHRARGTEQKPSGDKAESEE